MCLCWLLHPCMFSAHCPRSSPKAWAQVRPWHELCHSHACFQPDILLSPSSTLDFLLWFLMWLVTLPLTHGCWAVGGSVCCHQPCSAHPAQALWDRALRWGTAFACVEATIVEQPHCCCSQKTLILGMALWSTHWVVLFTFCFHLYFSHLSITYIYCAMLSCTCLLQRWFVRHDSTGWSQILRKSVTGAQDEARQLEFCTKWNTWQSRNMKLQLNC